MVYGSSEGKEMLAICAVCRGNLTFVVLASRFFITSTARMHNGEVEIDCHCHFDRLRQLPVHGTRVQKRTLILQAGHPEGAQRGNYIC